MNKYQRIAIGSLLAGVAVLAFYFLVTRSISDQEGGSSEPLTDTDNNSEDFEDQPVQAVEPIPSVEPTGLETQPESNENSSVRITAAWLDGWWSEDGFCEGDAGEGFNADGSWNAWGRKGAWSLNSNRLTIRELMRTFDTESGGPEPISPPIVRSGAITNDTAASFDFGGSEGISHMVRCD